MDWAKAISLLKKVGLRVNEIEKIGLTIQVIAVTGRDLKEKLTGIWNAEK